MDVRLPDGTVVKGVPEGITKAELINKLSAAGMGASFATAADKAMADPTAGQSFMENVRAGMGKKFTDIGRGVQQLVTPQAPTLSGLVTGDNRSDLQREIDESRKLDAPLMGTAGGFTGNVLGGMVAAAPALAIPGAQGLAGAALLGGAQGAVEPVATGESRALNTGIGAGGGFIGQGAGNLLARSAANKTASLATQQSLKAPRDAALKAGMEAGFVAPPSVTGGSFIGNRLESIGGKAALGQQASGRNQEVMNALARAEIGLPADKPITMGALETVRKEAGKAYDDVAALSDDAAEALKNLKDARYEASSSFKHYNRSADPAVLAKAKKAAADVKLWDRFLVNEAQVAGRPELIPALNEARTMIAKTYDVERALNTTTGDISTPTLAKMLDKGVPLTGGLKIGADFGNAFPRLVTEGAKTPTPGVSKMEAGLAALLGTTTGNPLLATLPLASPAVRAGLLSGPAQRMMVPPSYAPGVLNQAMGSPLTAPSLRLAVPQLSVLGAPSFFPTER